MHYYTTSIYTQAGVRLLVQSVQVEYTNFSEKVAGLHGREYPSSLADYFEYPVGNDKHLSGNFAFAAYRVTRGKYVRFHFQDQIVQKLRLAFLD